MVCGMPRPVLAATTLFQLMPSAFLELSKSEDALRPFVLACETKQVKLVTIAIGCIQKLISFHAIPEVRPGTFFGQMITII